MRSLTGWVVGSIVVLTITCAVLVTNGVRDRVRIVALEDACGMPAKQSDSSLFFMRESRRGTIHERLKKLEGRRPEFEWKDQYAIGEMDVLVDELMDVLGYDASASRDSMVLVPKRTCTEVVPLPDAMRARLGR